MALTATQAAVHPSWDETIVPTLRKRLESESRTLSKRLSAISTSSVEAPSVPYTSTVDSSARDRKHSPAQSSKGSAIPRPSLQSSRPSIDQRPDGNHTSSQPNGTPSSPKPRARTNSQPHAFDSPLLPNGKIHARSHTNGNGIGIVVPRESSHHSTSSFHGRVSDAKPTRIPKAAPLVRNLSLSNHSHLPSSQSHTTFNDARSGNPSLSNPPTPASPDFRVLAEISHYPHYSHSTVSVHSQHQSRLTHEPAPFNSDSRSSVNHSMDHSMEEETTGRRSNESEERPFEHWYRGEISRNGGVGELRVAKRQEMLEIASYGHTFRKMTPRTLARGLPEDTSRRRKRADSATGIGDRESLYLDEEHAKEIARVLDEVPLTDLEPEEESDYSTPVRQEASSMAQSLSGRQTPTNPSISSRLPPSRIPAPAPPRQLSEPPRSPIAMAPQRGASEPPSFPSPPSPLQPEAMVRSASQPQPQEQAGSKRRGKSPGAPPSATKRSKATANAIASKKAAENTKDRRSVAYYPTPEGDVDMAYAIPSWTQPVPPSGNWDDAVLPVVARKKGLEGQYEKAVGGSLPKRTKKMVEPAPGTFGFDHSKIRIAPLEDISMDEFGLPPDDNAKEDHGREEFHPHDERLPVRTTDPISPHHRPKDTPGEGVPPVREQQSAFEKDDDGGCCKCVIM